MSKRDLTQEVKSYIKRLGPDLVGIAPVERFAQAPPVHHPEDILPQAKNVVVFAMRLLESTFASPAPLSPDPMLTDEVCPKANCNICVEKCPQQALSPQGINRARCVRSPGEYGLYGTLNHIRNIVNETNPEKRNEMLFGSDTWGIWMHLQYGGGPSRCRVCLESCPVGKRTLH